MISSIISEMTISVSELNEYVARLFERDELLGGVLVRGEISNFKLHSSGHMYFTLKDENASIRCVMFRQDAMYLDFLPKNGDGIIAGGYIGLFKKEGQYQLYAKTLRREGAGALFEKFEKLKAKLETEGLFAAERKKPIPLFPKRIGVAASKTGAVIRDIINVSTRRNPGVDLLLYPVAVQGEKAKQEIAEAIDYFNRRDDIDVIILARGGGSIENLWAFNEEVVARAISSSKIHVVSAVGHETDFTISDFVADLRAPTPSAAAELIVPQVSEYTTTVNRIIENIKKSVTFKTDRLFNRIESVKRTILFTAVPRMINQYQQRVEFALQMIELKTINRLAACNSKVEACTKRLNALNPQNVLRRGYAIVLDAASGKAISSVGQVRIGPETEIGFMDGSARAVFTGQISIKEGKNG